MIPVAYARTLVSKMPALLSSIMQIPEDKYEYVPLPTYSANRHITRVLRLLPDSNFSAPVRCELQEVSLDEKPVYEAISYCWGAPLEFHPILCRDKRLNVSPNLTAALRHLRRPETHRALWADAICISQDDILERSQQVQMMQNIFEGAEHVLVWLGEADADSRLAMKLVEAVQQACGGLPRAFDADHITLNELCQHGLSAELVQEGKYSLKRLLWRPWFQRVWVIQEVAVARAVTVQCGHDSVSWDVFIVVLRVLDTANVLTTSNSLDFERLGSPNLINDARSGYRGTLNVSNASLPKPLLSDEASPDVSVITKFLGALGFSLWFRRWSATDPRDKLFAIRGLTERTVHPMRLEVDYTKTVSKVYHEFAVGMVSTMQSLDILSTPRAHTRIADGLPSWVPDWSEAGSVALVGQLSSRFRATKDTKYHPRFLAEQTVLIVEGEIVDEIWEIGLPLDPSHKALDQSSSKGLRYLYDSIVVTAYYQKILADWERLAGLSELEDYITREDINTVYKQTLTAAYRRRQDTIAAYNRWQQDSWPMRLLAWLNFDGNATLVLLTAALHLFLSPIRATNFRPQDALGWIQLSQRSSHEPWFPQRRSFERYLTMAFGRKLARTEKGYLALVPAETRVGDSVGLFKGGKTPLVVRPVGDSWQLVGDSYVHGIMNGEAFNEESCRNIHLI
jgi:hypothetical protein